MNHGKWIYAYVESLCLSLIFYNLTLGFKENLKTPISAKNCKMELRKRNFSTAFCSNGSHFIHFFGTFSKRIFHMFFQSHFQDAFFRIFHFCSQKCEKHVKKCVLKMRSEKMWKKSVLKIHLGKNVKMWKTWKKFKIQLGRRNSDFVSSGLIFWGPVLLQLLCCRPNFCRLKIGEEQFKSIGSGLCRSQICLIHL